MGNDFGALVGILDVKKKLIVIAVIAFIAFILGFMLAGCSTVDDREMMECEQYTWHGHPVNVCEL